jgi:integrase/recombinase XerD
MIAKLGVCSVAWISQRLPELDYISVNSNQLEEYLCLRKVEGLTNKWVNTIKVNIENYLNTYKWKINKKQTLDYLLKLSKKYSTSTYIKKVYQIRKFLNYLNIEWSKDIIPPPKPNYLPKRITEDYIQKALEYFKDNIYNIQIKSLIYLGITSGLRSEELYQLTLDDIDLDNRIIYINHNPENKQTTKTKTSRISFFNEDAKRELIEYLKYFNNNCRLKCLFNQSHISRLFRYSSIKVKDLRKFFSQEWDRRGGPTSIKKILMGHSLKGDVDLMHYNCQSEEDLKKIYDNVMSK